MPLPTGGAGTAWPPTNMADISVKHAEWDAWYVGETAALERVYGNAGQAGNRPSQYRGGVTGALARFWWGKPLPNSGSATSEDKLHVPIAADLCQASSDILFAQPPSFIHGEQRIQSELDQAVEQGLIRQLASSGEIGAALGDVYLRVTWDSTIADRSFITPVHADAAIPEFRWGRLVALTVWRELSDTNGLVVRHLERHELDGNGIGVIFHGLYQGTREYLGVQVPLTEYTSTAGIPVNADGFISTESRGLAVVHWPNKTPQRRWRQHDVGAWLGRSDLDGCEGSMDKLDMVYSSWMRDVRLAKSRLIVPNYMLESGGVGQGLGFDADQDVYVPVQAPPREDGKNEITPQQFTIRTADHLATCQELLEVILRTSGYSKQLFGEEDGVAMTATEVSSKDRRSTLTRDRKIREVTPALVQLLTKKLAVDAVIFRTGVTPDAPVVEFAQATSSTPEQLATTSNLLFQAQAASVRTRVAMQHPDWDEKQIAAEAALVLDEFSASVPDPFSFRPGVDEAPAGTGAGVGSDGAGQS
jgi:hypothetical protein